MTEGWKDETFYFDDQEGKIQPRRWKLKIGNVYINVCLIDGESTEWMLITSLFNVPNLDYGSTSLGTGDIGEAKIKAIRRVRKMLQDRIEQDTRDLGYLTQCDMCQEYAVIETIGNGSKSYKCLACGHLDVEDDWGDD